MEMKDYLSLEEHASVDARVQYFLDRFYMSRIGLRMLIHQHCQLTVDLHRNISYFAVIASLWL